MRSGRAEPVHLPVTMTCVCLYIDIHIYKTKLAYFVIVDFLLRLPTIILRMTLNACVILVFDCL